MGVDAADHVLGVGVLDRVVLRQFRQRPRHARAHHGGTEILATGLHELAEASAREILPRFGLRDVGLELKSDASPVTLADREAERVMREMIMANQEYLNRQESLLVHWWNLLQTIL